MTSMVAQLRRQMVFRQERGDTLALVPLEDLDTLLSIVERFAEFNPGAGRIACRYCHRYPEDTKHKPDCPWLAARRACGMDGEA